MRQSPREHPGMCRIKPPRVCHLSVSSSTRQGIGGGRLPPHKPSIRVFSVSCRVRSDDSLPAR